MPNLPWDVVAMLAALAPELFLGQPVTVQERADAKGRIAFGPSTANSTTRLLTVIRDPDQVPIQLHRSLVNLSRGKSRNCCETAEPKNVCRHGLPGELIYREGMDEKKDSISSLALMSCVVAPSCSKFALAPGQV